MAQALDLDSDTGRLDGLLAGVAALRAKLKAQGNGNESRLPRRSAPHERGDELEAARLPRAGLVAI